MSFNPNIVIALNDLDALMRLGLAARQYPVVTVKDAGNGLAAIFAYTDVAPDFADRYFHVPVDDSGGWFTRLGPLPVAIPQAQEFARLITSVKTDDTIELNIVYPGDSRNVTGNPNQIKIRAQNFAAANPTVEVLYREFTTMVGWSGDTTIQAATTGGTVRFSNGGLTGSTWGVYQGANEDFFFDAIVSECNLMVPLGGVNIGFIGGELYYMGAFLAMLMYFQSKCSQAAFVVSHLTPWQDHPTGDYTESAGQIKASSLLGMGYMDVETIWNFIPLAVQEDYANNWYVNDGAFLHPGSQGRQLVDRIHELAIFTVSQDMNFTSTQIAPAGSLNRQGLVSDPKGTQWDYTLGHPESETLVNCTAAQDASIYLTGGYSVQYTSTSATNPAYTQIDLAASIPIEQMQGKRVSVGFWAYVPAGTNDTGCGKVQFVGGNASYNGAPVGGWIFQVAHYDVPVSATNVYILRFVSFGGAGTSLGQTMNSDIYYANIGNVPAYPSSETMPVPIPNPGGIFNRDNLETQFVSSIITGSDNDITVTDVVNHPAIYANFPVIGNGTAYIASWVLAAGAVNGSVFAQNAESGTGSNITSTNFGALEIVWRSNAVTGCLNINDNGTGDTTFTWNDVTVVEYDYTVPRVTPVGTGANTTEDLLQYLYLPNDSLAEDGTGVLIEANGTYAANGNNKTVRLYLGSLVISSGIKTSNNLPWSMSLRVTRTGAGAQRYSGVFVVSGTAPALFDGTSTQDETDVLLAKCTGQNGTATAGDIICNYFSITPICGSIV